MVQVPVGRNSLGLVLQWGRDLTDADGSDTLGYVQSSTCFNGAAT